MAVLGRPGLLLPRHDPLQCRPGRKGFGVVLGDVELDNFIPEDKFPPFPVSSRILVTPVGEGANRPGVRMVVDGEPLEEGTHGLQFRVFAKHLQLARKR